MQNPSKLRLDDPGIIPGQISTMEESLGLDFEDKENSDSSETLINRLFRSFCIRADPVTFF